MKQTNRNIELSAGTWVAWQAVADLQADVDLGGMLQLTEDGRIAFHYDDHIVAGGANLTVIVPGKQTWTGRTRIWDSGSQEDTEPAIVLEAGTNPFHSGTITPRAPVVFPICHSCPSPYQYDNTLPWTLPETRDFLRANAWSVTVPGLPFVPGGSREHPERVLTYFYDLYARNWQDLILEAHWSRRYTHFVLSWPDSRVRACRSLDQFVETCHQIRSAGFYVHVMLASKDFDPHDQSVAQWQAALTPVLDELFASAAVDELGVWEWNLFNVPGRPTIDVFKWIGSLAHSADVSFWPHFSPEYTSWYADGDPRGRYGFWDDLGADVDGLDYQCQPTWDIGQIQSRLVDTLKQFAAQSNRHKLRAFEICALEQFTHDHPTEQEADDLAYLACCTHGPAKVWGSANGRID